MGIDRAGSDLMRPLRNASGPMGCGFAPRFLGSLIPHMSMASWFAITAKS